MSLSSDDPLLPFGNSAVGQRHSSSLAYGSPTPAQPVSSISENSALSLPNPSVSPFSADFGSSFAARPYALDTLRSGLALPVVSRSTGAFDSMMSAPVSAPSSLLTAPVSGTALMNNFAALDNRLSDAVNGLALSSNGEVSAKDNSYLDLALSPSQERQSQSFDVLPLPSFVCICLH